MPTISPRTTPKYFARGQSYTHIRGSQEFIQKIFNRGERAYQIIDNWATDLAFKLQAQGVRNATRQEPHHPQRQTGRLASSIVGIARLSNGSFVMTGKTESDNDVKNSISPNPPKYVLIAVGTNVFYGKFLEQGWVMRKAWGHELKAPIQVGPYPFIQPAIDEVVPREVKTLTTTLRDLK